MNIPLIVCSASAVVTAGILVLGWRLHMTGQLYWRRVAVVASAIFMSLLIGLLPFNTATTDETITNTDVVFLVDTTYSMNALDGRDGDTRLSDIQHDIKKFAQALSGSRIGILTYDARTSIYLPLTTTTSDIDIAADTLSTSEYINASSDPSLTNALKTTKNYLDKIAQVDATRNRVVVLMSDGELTGKADTTSSVNDAAKALGPAANATLAIGYGSNGGAKMPLLEIDYSSNTSQFKRSGSFADSNINGQYEDVISKRDEPMLKNIAADFGGSYIAAQDITKDSAALLQARQIGATKQSNSPTSQALRQNILHVPLALIILVWLFVIEVAKFRRPRKYLAEWRKK